MRRFAALYAALDETNKTNEKVSALKRYFLEVEPSDAAWAVFLLSGRKLRQIIPIRRLCDWAAEQVGVAPWMFEECYETVGDLAETISLLLPPAEATTDVSLTGWIEDRLIPLRDAEPSRQRAAMVGYWSCLAAERLVLHKLLTGAFRVGVSQRLVARALAQATGVEIDVITHRLAGDWEPSAAFFRQLVNPETTDARISQPFPFFLAHPLDEDPGRLGAIEDWQAEWKWDGIRGQVIRRQGETHIWSRGNELMTDRLPEIVAAAAELPDGTVIDGEIVAYREGVLPFAVMQKRIGRKALGKKILAEAPVAMIAFDLLEHEGRDVRGQPLRWRREMLERLLPGTDPAAEHAGGILLSPRVSANSWDALEEIRRGSRERNTEGLMLKRLDSTYGVGRTRGDWWKWKIQPQTVDAVLIYAQRGSGRRASLYTDYTFAVWSDDRQLVPFAKAYSGLDDAEIAEVDAFVRQNTRERFGPVRSVKPELVFEIAFDSVQRSTRHKSGVAARFPRIARWRRDKTISQADTLDALRSLMAE